MEDVKITNVRLNWLNSEFEMVYEPIQLIDHYASTASEQDIFEYMYAEPEPLTDEEIRLNIFTLHGKQIRTREQAKFAYAKAMLEARKEI